MLKVIRNIHDNLCQDSFVQPTPKRKRLSKERKRKKQDPPRETENTDASPFEEELVSVGAFY